MNLIAVPLGLYLGCMVMCSIHVILLEYRKSWLPRKLRKHSVVRMLPITCVALSIIMVVVSAAITPKESPQCALDGEINPDIGGVGVLLRLCIPTIVLLIVLILGHKRNTSTGAKELCLAHVASMLIFYCFVHS
jgi:amino acid transporter